MTETLFFRAGAQRYREHYGLFFDRFAPGQRYRHRPGVTLSQQDNADETLDSYNGAQIHFDERYAGLSGWRRPLMVSTLTIQRLLGMTAKTFGCRRDVLGFRTIALSAPVFGGDTIYAESEILECRDGLEPGLGVVTARILGYKDRLPDGAPAEAPIAFAEIVADFEIYTLSAWNEVARQPLGDPVREPRFAAYREENGARVEQWGLFFEDARPGETFVHAPRRTFYRGDVVRDARRAFDFAFSCDRGAWDDPRRGDRLRVPETMLLGAVTALTTRTFGRVSANLGWTEVVLAPVYEADTIEAESTIVAARASQSRPAEGVLTVDTHARREDGAEICRFRRNLLVYRRGGDTPYRKADY